MKFRKEPSGLYVVSLERGESLRTTIESLCKQEGISGAKLDAIGAIKDPTLGFYRLDQKRYEQQGFTGVYELVSCAGNITLKDGEPFMHVHVGIGDHQYQLWGGHLFDAQVGVVVELFLQPLETPLPRMLCEDIGLSRWEP